MIEKDGKDYSGYVPDLPGCVARGDTVEETEGELVPAIQLYLQGLREDGFVPPAAGGIFEYVFVPPQSSIPDEASFGSAE